MCRDSTEEHWQAIPGYEQVYEVSCYGRVRSLLRVVQHRSKGERLWDGRLLKPSSGTVLLSQGGRQTRQYVGSLVAQAFVPNPHHLTHVRHLDGATTNAMAANLEWTHTGRTRRTRHRPTPLTALEIARIQQRLKYHVGSVAQLATDYGVTRQTISLIKLGKLGTTPGPQEKRRLASYTLWPPRVQP